jgi:hypothetical protein
MLGIARFQATNRVDGRIGAAESQNWPESAALEMRKALVTLACERLKP